MNKLTPEQIASNLEAYKHAMEVGHWKDAQWQGSDCQWWDGSFNFPDITRCYRIRPKPPEPKWRAWRPEEVPVGALLMFPKICFGSVPTTIILAGRGEWVHFINPEDAKQVGVLSSQLLNDKWQVSFDHGKTWQPAGVREEVL